MTTSVSKNEVFNLKAPSTAQGDATTQGSMKLTYVTHLPALYEFLGKINSPLSPTDYLRALIKSGPDAVLLRAKELSIKEYEDLLTELLPIAKTVGTELIISHHIDFAIKYNLPAQLSVPECLDITAQAQAESVLGYKVLMPAPFKFGVSVHSLGEAQKGESQGAKWLVLGHLFPSRCKPGLAPRNSAECQDVLEFAKAHHIPLHAIGGINFNTFSQLPKGFAGIYVMTETMEQEDIYGYTKKWRQLLSGIE